MEEILASIRRIISEDDAPAETAAAPASEAEAAPAPAAEVATLPAEVQDARLNLFSAGRFDRLPPQCQAFAGRRIARCPIGKGEAWLVGDADLLFAPLWQPLVFGADHLRQADTMEWLAARLWPAAGAGVLRPLWIRARAD